MKTAPRLPGAIVTASRVRDAESSWKRRRELPVVTFTFWLALLFVACYLIVRSLMRMRSLAGVRTPAVGRVVRVEDSERDAR